MIRSTSIFFTAIVVLCFSVSDVRPVVAADADVILVKEKEKKKESAKEEDEKSGEKKPAAKKAGGGVMKALFKAFVPKIQVPQPPKQQEISIPDSATKTELLELEDKIKKKPSGKQYLKRYAPKFDTMRRGELRFIHDVCNLTRSEFVKVRQDVELVKKRALLEVVQYQMSIEQGWNGQPPKHPDIEGLFESGLTRAVEKHLSADQLADYRSEIEARQSFRKLADAEVIIAALDRDLHLTPKQRGEIVEPILEAWQSKWKQNIQLLANNGNRYLPKLPKSKIQKFLTTKQKTAFSSVGQYGSSFFGMQIDLPQENQADNDDLLEELEFAPEEESP